MEFEGFLIRDVIKFVEGKATDVSYHSEPFAMEGSGGKFYGKIYVNSEYRAWLSEITQGGTSYPDAPIDRVKFRQFARKFLETNRNYPISEYPLSDNLVYEPILFDELFNKPF